jgi:hypothetical protein
MCQQDGSCGVCQFSSWEIANPASPPTGCIAFDNCTAVVDPLNRTFIEMEIVAGRHANVNVNVDVEPPHPASSSGRLPIFTAPSWRTIHLAAGAQRRRMLLPWTLRCSACRQGMMALRWVHFTCNDRNAPRTQPWEWTTDGTQAPRELATNTCRAQCNFDGGLI